MLRNICKNCSGNFEITDDDLRFFDEISPVFDGKKYAIPPPTICPPCRQQRRLAFRNERKLYTRKCDMTGKSIISIYAPDKPYKVYDQEEWWSDKWDTLQYGRDFDFNRTLGEQLSELYTAVPHASLYNTNVENSYFTNFALNQKNCYLIFGGANNEDCMYGKFIAHGKDIVDGLALYSCELCYEGIASEKCYGCRFFINCRSCCDSTFIEECQGCMDCMACFGLRSKQHCFLNKQYSREEYDKIKQDYKYLTHEKIADLRQKLNELKKSLPHIQWHVFGSENSTGESVYNCKNCQSVFDSKECEDCKYMYFSPKAINTQDCTFCSPRGPEFTYNVSSSIYLQSSIATFYIWYGRNIYYSMECHYCNNIFGCVSLKRKDYCILNKQYSKEEYEKLAAKIAAHMEKTGEWGEYFPYNISPFGYNETIANEYFPWTREQALAHGANWRDEILEKDEPNAKYFKPTGDIRNIPENICKEILKCEITGKKFKIIPKELAFYKRMGIPIPVTHPDQRHYDRLKHHSPVQLYPRKCAKCKKDIQTFYKPASPEMVYCEECYLKETY